MSITLCCNQRIMEKRQFYSIIYKRDLQHFNLCSCSWGTTGCIDRGEGCGWNQSSSKLLIIKFLSAGTSALIMTPWLMLLTSLYFLGLLNIITAALPLTQDQPDCEHTSKPDVVHGWAQNNFPRGFHRIIQLWPLWCLSMSVCDSAEAGFIFSDT